MLRAASVLPPLLQVVDSFLLPEMVGRIAAMLNYFLKYLTGPERKGLKVRGQALQAKQAWLAMCGCHNCRHGGGGPYTTVAVQQQDPAL